MSGRESSNTSGRDACEKSGKRQYVGEVAYLYAYDVASVIETESIQRLLGEPVKRFGIFASRRVPKEMFFYRTRMQMLRLPAIERVGPHGPVQVERTVKLFSVGAVSICIRVPVVVEHIQNLALYHDLRFGEVSVHDLAKELAQDVLRDLGALALRPVGALHEEEAYTVFCIRAPVTEADGKPVSGESWLLKRRRQVASALTQETDLAHLSEQEADESTDMFLSYYDQDLVVVDWDAAMIVDEPANWPETLHVMELANVQLAELETYDRTLDEALEKSYRDLNRRSPWRGQATLAGLREIRVDLARLADELSNITKFFGDWHLARIYQNLSARFHLADWQRTIDNKVRTLDGLYQILRQDQLNRWMLVLEIMIVLLFVIDLIVIIPWGK